MTEDDPEFVQPRGCLTACDHPHAVNLRLVNVNAIQVQNGRVSTGEELLEERRRRRRAGDPRLSAEGRELFQRMTTGDLVDEFQAGLDADLAADPLLGGHSDDDA